MPDSDTAMLVSLVSNTASTVSNTLKILEVAEKTSDQIDKYNAIAMRRFFIARRIEQHARDIAAATQMSSRDLRELNQVLLLLKNNLRGLKSNIDAMAMEVFQAENFSNRHYDKLANSMQDANEAHHQELQSGRKGNMSIHVQNTAMNTALNAKVLTKIRQDSLDYQNTDLGLKKGEAKEKLRKEEHYKNWIGIRAGDSNGDR